MHRLALICLASMQSLCAGCCFFRSRRAAITHSQNNADEFSHQYRYGYHWTEDAIKDHTAHLLICAFPQILKDSAQSKTVVYTGLWDYDPPTQKSSLWQLTADRDFIAFRWRSRGYKITWQNDPPALTNMINRIMQRPSRPPSSAYSRKEYFAPAFSSRNKRKR